MTIGEIISELLPLDPDAKAVVRHNGEHYPVTGAGESDSGKHIVLRIDDCMPEDVT